MLRKNRISAELLLKEPENTLFAMLEHVKIEDIKEEAMLAILDYLIRKDENKAISLLKSFKIPEAKTAALAKLVSFYPKKKFIAQLKECINDIQLAEIALETLLESNSEKRFEIAQIALELLDINFIKQNKIMHALLRAKTLTKLEKQKESKGECKENIEKAKENLDFLSSEIKKSNLWKNAEGIFEIAKGYITLGLVGDAVILIEYASRKFAKDIRKNILKNKEDKNGIDTEGIDNDGIESISSISSENILEIINNTCELAILSKKRRFVDLALELKDEIEKTDSDLFTICEIESIVAETLAHLDEKEESLKHFKNAIEYIGNSIQIEHELEIKSCADAVLSHALRSAKSKDDILLEDIFGKEDIDWNVANSLTVIESILVLAKKSKDYELMHKALELSKRLTWKKRVCAMLMISEIYAYFSDEKSFSISFNDALSNIPFQIFKKEEISIAWKESIESAVNSLLLFENHT